MTDQTNKPGFFQLPVYKTCRNPNHDVPSHLYVPAGQGYRHVCPACGHTSVIYNPGEFL